MILDEIKKKAITWSCEGCEHYLTTKENPLVVCNIRSCKDYSHYKKRGGE